MPVLAEYTRVLGQGGRWPAFWWYGVEETRRKTVTPANAGGQTIDFMFYKSPFFQITQRMPKTGAR